MSNLEKHDAEQAELTALCESGECGHGHCLRKYDERQADRGEQALDLLREVIERTPDDEGDYILYADEDGKCEIVDRIRIFLGD